MQSLIFALLAVSILMSILFKDIRMVIISLIPNIVPLIIAAAVIGFVGIEKVMISLTRNDYEPDVCYFTKEKSKGFKRTQSLFPAPDLVVEFLSKKTAHRDRGIKYEDYEKHGVQEYWIISPETKVVEQYRLVKDKYKLVKKSNSGEIESHAVKGFKIPIKSIFDKKLNLKILSELLQ